ncbi:MAG: hydroxymethylglutaryl-CoA lyase [Planctomycetia bacterium]|nr:hydroxymethylglutaryl-CoA lyase [Planctomycetia bacterium]OQZ03860.1 MAG: hydroxymethylglutaryl-CoA lyase [Planctomycetes bacterium UTPLA1]
MSALPKEVKIVEVGPRDGLQNEPEQIPTDLKLAFIAALAGSGLRAIEATSFVHPKAIPQLADAVDVAGRLPPAEGVTYSALVPNQKGLDRALETGIRRIAVFTAASDSFTKKNINMTVDESLATFAPVVKSALAAGLTVRGYVSTSFVCPYEGNISKDRVLDVTTRLLDMGIDEVAVSDTIGAAAPTDVFETVGHLLKSIPPGKFALHLHDTYGTALANVLAGLQLGITTFDSSAGGLGGCPYAPGASGNLATEDLVYMLDRMGIQCGVNLQTVFEASSIIADKWGRTLPSRQWQRMKAACR